jgi:hypothetical protein
MAESSSSGRLFFLSRSFSRTMNNCLTCEGKPQAAPFVIQLSRRCPGYPLRGLCEMSRRRTPLPAALFWRVPTEPWSLFRIVAHVVLWFPSRASIYKRAARNRSKIRAALFAAARRGECRAFNPNWRADHFSRRRNLLLGHR